MLLPYVNNTVHAEGRHGHNPRFVKVCAQCRTVWTAEVMSLLIAYHGDNQDLASMTPDEYQEAVEAHQEADAELKLLAETWGDHWYTTITTAAALQIRCYKIAQTLF